MKQANSTIPLALAMCMLAACQCQNGGNNGNMDGGPCAYDEYRVPARIIKFEKMDSVSIEVVCKLDSNEWVPPPYDTIDFYMEKGRFLTVAEADSLKLQKGSALTYLVQRIKSGSCNPEINTLLLEPMK